MYMKRHKCFLSLKAVLKQKLLAPILQVVFPILSATPPPGEEDPEDKENAEGDTDSESPKHFAAQVTLQYLTLIFVAFQPWLERNVMQLRCLQKNNNIL